MTDAPRVATRAVRIAGVIMIGCGVLLAALAVFGFAAFWQVGFGFGVLFGLVFVAIGLGEVALGVMALRRGMRALPAALSGAILLLVLPVLSSGNRQWLIPAAAILVLAVVAARAGKHERLAGDA
jgi:hypothetical protein